MSSRACSSFRERLLLACAFVGVVFASGCGPVSDPRTPLRMVRVDAEASSPKVVRACDDGGDDDAVELDVSAKAPVEYVRLSEWQPPPSVVRLESEMVARGDVPRTYVQFPKLSLHRPIGETTIRPTFQGRYAIPIWSSDPAYVNRPASAP